MDERVDRAEFLKRSALGAAAMVVAGFAPTSPAVSRVASRIVPAGSYPERPNILLLVVDDLPAHMAYDPRIMPKMTGRVFSRGVRMLRAYCHVPLCGPATAAMYSGKVGRRTNVDTNEASWSRFKNTNSHLQTIATDLKASGYRCGHFGKHMLGRKEDFAVPPGYDRWVEWLTSTINIDGEDAGTPPESERFFAEEAVSFIEASEREPWYACVFLTSPHSPYAPSAEHADDFDGAEHNRPNVNEDTRDKPGWMRGLAKKDRWRMDKIYEGKAEESRDADDQFALVLNHLDATVQTENTLIIFTSDNGYLMGEHRLTHKDQPYEESARVPLVFAGAGVAAGKWGTLASHLDIRPTIASFVGGPSKDVDGRNLREGLLSGSFTKARKRLLVEGSRAEGTNPGGAFNPTGAWDMLRSGDWSFVLHADGTKELYDLARDPYQLTNVRARHDRFAAKLAREARALGEAQGRELRRLENAE